MKKHQHIDAIEATVCGIIAHDLNLESKNLTPETGLDSLGIDSLRAISILYTIEDHFGIEVPNDEIESLEQIGDIISAVARNL